MKLFSRAAAAAVVAGALALTGCSNSGDAPNGSAASGDTITVKHAKGELKLDGTPEKVVVLDYAALDVMEAIGESDKVVSISTAKAFPAVAKPFEDKATAGAMKEPDFETIAQAEPDLIIVNGRQKDAYSELEKIAPTLDLTASNGTATLDVAVESARTVGQIFGKEKEVDEKIKGLKDKANKIAEKANGTDAMLVMTNGGELSTYGPDSRFGIVYHDLGFKPATEVKMDGRHGEAISFEYVAKANPTHIFVVDRDKAIGSDANTAEATLDNELIKGTKAAKDNNIHYLNGADWYLVGGGLTTLNSMLDEVDKAVDANA